jgi:hypothetical protein
MTAREALRLATERLQAGATAGSYSLAQELMDAGWRLNLNATTKTDKTIITITVQKETA